MWDGYIYINKYVQSDLSCSSVFQIPLQLKSKATLGPWSLHYPRISLKENVHPVTSWNGTSCLMTYSILLVFKYPKTGRNLSPTEGQQMLPNCHLVGEVQVTF